ncbi:rhomboid family intramembrane serine protease [Aerococcus sp. 1KP-2016]|jgi:rhomboid protease GluP|uniref:rhomboid family intramembrane serine protease n=1 Tax=Aerococcus sp. 1KP-2016 TaxID=1981982 RepID=UPI000B989635|nr:rhomboid family intramembrane serine protease [Aerococcus sp. 1KP-2016]OYQ68255.1 rhomboid family intramembrane serine protease [Aerococcus sp. 1KP-2016]
MANKKPYVTYGLIAIQVVLFLAMQVMGGSESALTLILFGAKFNPLIAAGEYWRLIMPIFLHIGWMHLLINTITLYYLGSMVENILGHWKYLVIYLTAGIMGNLFSYQFSDNVSAGASTALFGLFAVFLALRNLYPSNRYIQSLGSQYMTLIGINLVFGFLGSGIDIWGHIGGIVGGFLITMTLMKGEGHDDRKVQRIGSLAVYLIIAIFILLNQGTANVIMP